METIDTAYEFAGYQGAAGLHEVLLHLGIPLIVALAGIAWRFFRVAEDGLARPLAVYVISLLALWWLLTPMTVDARADVRAPRFVALLGSASDTVVRRSIRTINRDFLSKPFEWERLAALCGLARVYDPPTRENLHAFFEGCTRPAIAALTEPPGPDVERNPLSTEGRLPYHRFTFVWRAGPDRGLEVTCEAARKRLTSLIRADIEGNRYHAGAIQALREYESRGSSRKDFRKLYFDQVVHNEWIGMPTDGGEMLAVRAAVGRYDIYDPRANAVRLQGSRTMTVLEDAAGLVGVDAMTVRTLAGYWQVGADAGMSVYGAFTQATSNAVEAKQKYYLVTTVAPELYGLCVMVLIALFPIAGVWALVPGKWTALVNYGKIFVSVKLWPVGWALLSSFSSRRPTEEAFAVPGQPDPGTGNLFLAVVMMYFLVPGVCFLLVNAASAAAAMPFREAVPAAAGGSPAREAMSVASFVR